MSPNEKVNILMVDDQPAKLLSYEVMLGGLGENLIKATVGEGGSRSPAEERRCRRAHGCKHARA
jgi:response regulator RpfG family c-di-GMP phosphodiesterase